WLLSQYPAGDVKEIAEQAAGQRERERAAGQRDPAAIELFRQFGADLGEFLAPWIKGFGAEALVIGGSIAHAAELFLPALRAAIDIPVIASQETELMAIAGAASLPVPGQRVAPARKSRQPMLPREVETKIPPEEVGMRPPPGGV